MRTYTNGKAKWDDATAFERQAPGTIVPAGAEIALLHGSGDSRRTIEATLLTADFEVPATVNGHWYGREVYLDR